MPGSKNGPLRNKLRSALTQEGVSVFMDEDYKGSNAAWEVLVPTTLNATTAGVNFQSHEPLYCSMRHNAVVVVL